MAIILVVDDEVGIRELLSEILIDEGYDVRLAENARLPGGYGKTPSDLVLLDIWMPDTDGFRSSRSGTPEVSSACRW